MTNLILNDQVGFSRRSVDALVEVVKVLRKDDDLPAHADLSLETARAIKYIFDNLAWSDGHLSSEEVRHLHRLLEGYDWLRNSYIQVESSEPRTSGINKIPQLVFHAIDHDERNGTHYAPMLINSLEMIAYGVIAADGEATPEELHIFREHIAAMRSFLKTNRKA